MNKKNIFRIISILRIVLIIACIIYGICRSVLIFQLGMAENIWFSESMMNEYGIILGVVIFLTLLFTSKSYMHKIF